jgi:hypothetical protein
VVDLDHDYFVDSLTFVTNAFIIVNIWLHLRDDIHCITKLAWISLDQLKRYWVPTKRSQINLVWISLQ